jgi:hypothetical protein
MPDGDHLRPVATSINDYNIHAIALCCPPRGSDRGPGGIFIPMYIFGKDYTCCLPRGKPRPFQPGLAGFHEEFSYGDESVQHHSE